MQSGRPDQARRVSLAWIPGPDAVNVAPTSEEVGGVPTSCSEKSADEPPTIDGTGWPE